MLNKMIKEGTYNPVVRDMGGRSTLDPLRFCKHLRRQRARLRRLDFRRRRETEALSAAKSGKEGDASKPDLRDMGGLSVSIPYKVSKQLRKQRARLRRLDYRRRRDAGALSAAQKKQEKIVISASMSPLKLEIATKLLEGILMMNSLDNLNTEASLLMNGREEVVRKNNTLQAKIKIGGVDCTALVDTGASISVIAQSLLDSIKKEAVEKTSGREIKINPSPLTIKMGNATTARSQGIVELDVEFATKQTRWGFEILSTSSMEAFMGLDFLQAHGAVIDTATCTVSFPKDLASIVEESVEREKANDVLRPLGLYAMNTVMLPPWSNAHIPVRISPLRRAEVEKRAFGFAHAFGNMHYMTAVAPMPGYVQLEDGKAHMFVGNLGGGTLEIKEGDPIAFLECRKHEIPELIEENEKVLAAMDSADDPLLDRQD
jgi:hypothetical protein